MLIISIISCESQLGEMELIKQLFPQLVRIPSEQCFHVVLAHRNLFSIPRELIPVGDYVTVMDLSNNDISDVSFLRDFKNLEIIVLDHNQIHSGTIFPKLPKLKTLWLNHNKIDKIIEFLACLAKRCPKLQVLSLLGNQAAATCKTSSSLQEVVVYRYSVISEFPSLIYLDDGPVTRSERIKASKMFQKPTVLKSLVTKSSELVNVLSLKPRDNRIV